MATLAQLQEALINADKAGAADDARKLADAIRAMRTETPKSGAVIPGTPEQPVYKAPQYSLLDRLKGEGEAGLTAATAMAAMPLGTFGGIAKSILQGGYGTPEGANNADTYAGQMMNALTYQPRTPAGQEATEKIGKLAQGLAPMVGLPTEVGAISSLAKPSAAYVSTAAGEATRDAAKSVAKRLMQSAVKPTIEQLRTGQAQTAIDTLLNYGISPTESGVNKLKGLIAQKNDQITSAIGGSKASINKANVLDAASDVRNKFGNQVSPTSDLNAISGVVNDFNATTPDLIPIQKAQQLKQGTYRVLANKYGEIGSAETEAQKALARGLKEQISSAVPEVAGLNAEESKLLTTLSVTERRALMEMNKNPAGLALLAHNPGTFAAFLADRSAAFKALAARLINRTGELIGPAVFPAPLPSKATMTPEMAGLFGRQAANDALAISTIKRQQ